MQSNINLTTNYSFYYFIDFSIVLNSKKKSKLMQFLNDKKQTLLAD